MDKGKPVGDLECGDLFKTRATRRWGKMYGTAPGAGAAVKIAASLKDIPESPLRWIDPRILVDQVGYVILILSLLSAACGSQPCEMAAPPCSTAGDGSMKCAAPGSYVCQDGSVRADCGAAGDYCRIVY